MIQPCCVASKQSTQCTYVKEISCFKSFISSDNKTNSLPQSYSTKELGPVGPDIYPVHYTISETSTNVVYVLIIKGIQVEWISVDRQGCSTYVSTHAT